MYYCLNKNVYLVKGKSKDCIYDLDKKKLYHIQKEFSDLIERICSTAMEKLSLTEEESKAVENLKRETRRYAKRQLTWFRKNKNVRWVYTDGENDFPEVEAISLAKEFLKD